MRTTTRKPWDMNTNHGFVVETEIKESTIPGGGLGRFLVKGAKKGDCIYNADMIPVEQYVKDNERGSILEDVPEILVISSKQDMDRLLHYFSSKDESDIAEVSKMLSWFVGGLYEYGSKENPESEHSSFCVTHSVKVNHSIAGANFIPSTENGKFVLKPLRDIEAGEELLCDYRNFALTAEVKEWFAERNLVDTQSMAVNLTAA